MRTNFQRTYFLLLSLVPCHPRKLNPRIFLKLSQCYGAQGLIKNDPRKRNCENPGFRSSAKITSLENLYALGMYIRIIITLASHLIFIHNYNFKIKKPGVNTS